MFVANNNCNKLIVNEAIFESIFNLITFKTGRLWDIGGIMVVF